MSERIPGAEASTVLNSSLAGLGGNTRKPLIIGVGDILVPIEVEKVKRGTTAGGKDVLAYTLYDSSSILKVGNSPSATDWSQTAHWVVDTVTNSISWESGAGIGGDVAITKYGVVATIPDTSSFTVTDTGWSAVNSYYNTATATVTNPDSSNYGTTKTVTNYVAATRKFFVDTAFAHPILTSDTILITLQPDEPAANQEYYVSYKKKLNTFTIQEYNTEADVKAIHGDITLSNGSPNYLTIGALLALRNGAASVMVGQLDYTAWGNKLSPTSSEFNASLSTTLEAAKLLVDNKLYIAPMTTESSAIASVWGHCKVMSSPDNKGERTCVSGMVRGTKIGSSTEDFTFVKQGMTYSSTRMILVAPSDCRFNDISSVQLDGSIAAAAYAGKRCFPSRVTQPISGESLTGITVETTYSASQQRTLLGAGIAVILNKAGIPIIIHDKSTNTATADTEENAIVELADYLNRNLRDTLWNIYKNAPIDSNLPGSMAATMSSIFEREILNVNITEYKDINVQQSTSEPRLMLVNSKVRPVYAVTWITIQTTFFI